ncbi:MAG TPA: photosynthetic reaction center cytochrome c subunit family protein [Terriglobia bacterium]|nr:photosynthetic reaction center cytochrome c subunit family protein [Terriglobia bacterium]
MVTMTVFLLALVAAAGQAGPDQNRQMSDIVFKNVQVLKGIPVDEFMDTMGMFAASLGYDCSSCHSPEIRSNRDAFAIETPAIQRARGMIAMVNNINRSYFRGDPRVSCFTCHRGNYTPEIVPSLALQYGELKEDPNAMVLFPDRRTSADQVFEKYFQALGGKERLTRVTTFVATGIYSGFNTGGADVPVEIFASAPDRRTQIIHMSAGDGVKTYDGRNAWVAEEWRPVPLVTLTGGNLAGARLDAILSFPGAIQKAFSQWQVGNTVIDDRPIQILQGTNAGETPVNLYFDESGLLVRVVRWNKTAVGTVPTQMDYADYREVAGIKLPFRTIVTWTDGQNSLALNEVQPNVPIDAAKFTRPAPFKRR